MINTAIRLQHLIEKMLEDGLVTVMLTGGRSAFKLYSEWREIEGFSGLTNVIFYFGDERVVPVDSPESNYGMVMNTLFLRGVPSGCIVKRMETEGGSSPLK